MKYQFFVICLLVGIVPVIVEAKTSAISEKSCSGLAKKIQYINSRLRAGYSLKKGEILKNKLRKLQNREYHCWQRRLSTK